MSTSSYIISLFNTVRESYAPIAVPPTGDDMVRLRKAILTILYSISLGANAGCPYRLILTYTAYKLLLGTTVIFDPMIGTFKSYAPSIEDNSPTDSEKRWNENGLPGSPPSCSSKPAKCDAGPSSSSLSKILGSSVFETRTPYTPVLP